MVNRMMGLTIVFALLSISFNQATSHSFSEAEMEEDMAGRLTDSEVIYGLIRGRFGQNPWLAADSARQTSRQGRKLTDRKNSRLWPDARVPYEFADTIDHEEWLIVQRIFANISSATNIQFTPRTARDTDYLLITEDIKKYGCGCCSIGVGYLEGSGAHVLVLGPVGEGGCGVNHIGGTHEMLHILGLAHVQNRADRCNYIDVDTSLLEGWGEWRVGQITGAADWFQLRIPYDCSSYVHYYQLQGAVWKKSVMDKVDKFMESQGCEDFQRGEFVNQCLVKGGYTENGRVLRDGYDRCLDDWDKKHKACVETVIQRFPTFHLVDPNGRCKENGINKSKRETYQLSQWDIWALNAAYGGQLPPCQYPARKGNGICDVGNNNIGCDYDGGDCCLPQANARDCIDPCGVRVKFYNGTNRACSKAPTHESFCRDHYWYGPNKCSSDYCRVTDGKYLEWQCKSTCNLCNVDPDRKEMDQICSGYLADSTANSFTSRPLRVPSPQPTASPRTTTVVDITTTASRTVRTTTTAASAPLATAATAVRTATTAASPPLATAATAVRTTTTAASPPLATAAKKPLKQVPPRQNSIQNEEKQRKQQTASRNLERDRSTGGDDESGFVVIDDPERRLALRSYWTRKG